VRIYDSRGRKRTEGEGQKERHGKGRTAGKGRHVTRVLHKCYSGVTAECADASCDTRVRIGKCACDDAGSEGGSVKVMLQTGLLQGCYKGVTRV
jgi:hypothetical protein